MSTPGDTLSCGHSLADLSEYLDTGRIGDPGHLADCPECQSGLASLRRLSALGNELLDADTAAAGSGSDDWMKAILGNLRLELRPGRSIPAARRHTRRRPHRDRGRNFGTDPLRCGFPARHRCRKMPPVRGRHRAGGPHYRRRRPRRRVRASPGTARRTLRQELATTLARQTELNITAIDVTITDVLEPRNPEPQSDPQSPATPAAEPWSPETGPGGPSTPQEKP